MGQFFKLTHYQTEPPSGGFFIFQEKPAMKDDNAKIAGMTKEEVIVTIKECAEKLGHAPSLTELQSMTKVTKRTIRKHFCTYVLALQACGLERSGCGYYVSMETLFKEWAGTVRRLGKVPTIAEFELRGKFSARPLMTR